jgi:eukaryotic-like serine/threonine-protein kinase
MKISPGTRLGRYEIRSHLGAGGMGEVYLAQDTQLDRAIALKILPSNVVRDRQRMHRFVQEAKAAAGLNHPNIAHIYEIGETDGTSFIAMEYIDGQTLRQHLKQSQLSVSEILDISIQIASALGAAHEAGIVHRDIKPDNIMLRRDGLVKVLDFGLVKLTEPQSATDTEAPTKALVHTDAGTVMGTANYMSPEQARGQKVDARTDIWSLGVMLYEMSTGRLPFAGGTATDIIASIVKTEPMPVTRLSPELPAKLEEIVAKALEKDREERYQTVKDLLVDMRRLRKRLEFEAELERSKPADGIAVSSPLTSSGRPAIHITDERTARTSDVSAPPPTSSAEYLVSEIKRHKRAAIVALTAFVIAMTVLGVGLYRFASQNRSIQTTQSAKLAPSQTMKITRLTADGKAGHATISPDGKYLVYMVRDAGQQSLWVKQVATASTQQITRPAKDVEYGRLTFSPDGNYIYYPLKEPGTPSGVLYRVPVLGGAPRKILVNIASPVTFSPDGNRIAFVRLGTGEDQMMVANADGTGEYTLAARKGETFFDIGGPAWSPDGKTIASCIGSYSGGLHYTVITVQVEDGAQKEFTTQKWIDGGRVAWLVDGSGVVVHASEEAFFFAQLWLVSYPGGEARRITNDLNDYRGVSLTADSNSLVTVQGDMSTNVWLAPSGAVNRAKQITSGKADGANGIAWTPDGRIVYSSHASGNLDIWIMDAEGGNQTQLTNDPRMDYTPTVSPDGRYIVFVSHRAGFPSLWRMNIDGGNLLQLTDGPEDYNPQISPDGRWIVFDSWRSWLSGGRRALWKMPIDGGDPVQLTDRDTLSSDISPDGELIACFSKEQLNLPWRIMVLPFEGGDPIKTFDLPTTVDPVNREFSVVWTPDGRAITYIDTRGGTWNVWAQPLDGGPPRQLTDYKTNGVGAREWSRDGKQLILTRGTVTRDVVLISNFK